MALIETLAGLGMRRAGTWDNELTREMFPICLCHGVAWGALRTQHLGGFVGGGRPLLVEGLRSHPSTRRLAG